MISIAICDDSASMVNSLNESIREYAVQSGKEIRTFLYQSGTELLADYSGKFDLIFLDIKMPGMNGVETARKIREKDTGVIIIFLTSLVQYALEGYKVNAANYLIKPVGRSRLNAELDRWIREVEQREEPYLCLHNDNGNYKVLLKNISFIETYNRNLMVHTSQQDIVCYWKMKEMEKRVLPYGFARNHSSYLVNLFYVENIEKNDVRLSTGDRLPLSKAKKKEFMEKLAEYWGSRI